MAKEKEQTPSKAKSPSKKKTVTKAPKKPSKTSKAKKGRENLQKELHKQLRDVFDNFPKSGDGGTEDFTPSILAVLQLVQDVCGNPADESLPEIGLPKSHVTDKLCIETQFAILQLQDLLADFTAMS